MKLDKRLIISCFVSFVEAGTTFGTSPVNTVSRDVFPDTTTFADTWSSLGDVLDASMEPVTEDYGDTVPSAIGGGYVKESDIVVLQDILKLSLNSHTEPIHRLCWGAAAELVDGEAVTPFANRTRFVEGWIAFTSRGQDNADRMVAALYVRIRLDGNPKWSKDPTRPAISCEVIQSAIQTLVPDNIIA
jgi:hypothetical protein